MRIRLGPQRAPTPVPKDPTPQQVQASWATWVASHCPRTPLEKPVEKIRLLNNLKPYAPPIQG
jgi:hypothetical protein